MPIRNALLAGLLIGAGALSAAAADEPRTGTEPQASASPAAAGRIARSTFTTRVIDREPVDSVTELTTSRDRIYYYTELLGMAGRTVVHRWRHDGRVMAEVSFEIGGPRWRVWSSKRLLAQWTGDWEVSVLNAAGEVLGGNRFAYVRTGR